MPIKILLTILSIFPVIIFTGYFYAQSDKVAINNESALILARESAQSGNLKLANKIYSDQLDSLSDKGIYEYLTTLISYGKIDSAFNLINKIDNNSGNLDYIINDIKLLYYIHHNKIAEIQEIMKSEEGNPSMLWSISAPMIKSWILFHNGKIEESKSVIASYKNSIPSVYYSHLGRMYASIEDYQSAAKFYSISMGSNASLESAVEYAYIEYKNNNIDTAVDIYNTLINDSQANKHNIPAKMKKLKIDFSLASAVSMPMYYMTSTLIEAGEVSTAQNLLSYINIIMPTYDNAKLQYAYAMYMQGHYSRAAQIMSSVNPKSYAYINEYFDIINIYNAMGYNIAARKYIKYALFQENNPMLLNELGKAYGENRMPSKAINTLTWSYKQSLESGNENATWLALYFRGIEQQKVSNWEKSKVDLQAAIKINDSDAYLLNYLAYSIIERNDHSKEDLNYAIDLLEKALKLKANDPFIMDSYGLAMIKTKDYDKSENYLTRALRVQPHNPEIINHLGDLYWLQGKKQLALGKWKTAYNLADNSLFKANIKNKILKHSSI